MVVSVMTSPVCDALQQWRCEESGPAADCVVCLHAESVSEAGGGVIVLSCLSPSPSLLTLSLNVAQIPR